jgi:hypothetical protein
MTFVPSQMERDRLMCRKILVIGIALLMMLGTAVTVLAQVQVHGFLLARTMVTNTNYAERIDRYGLRIMQKVDDEFDWLTEIYVHPSEADARSRLYMESAYLNWNLQNRLPWDFSVRIGKGRNFTYGLTPSYSSRRTTDYSLYSEAFTQVRVSGFQTFSYFMDKKVKLSLALLDPYTLKSRPVPDFTLAFGKFINIPICDRDNDTGAVRNRAAVSGRLAYETKILKIGVDGYVSQTGPDKIGNQKQKNALNRFGASGELKLDTGLMAQGQVTMASTACDLDGNPNNGTEKDLSHTGGEALVGFENPMYGLYARYGMLAYDKKFQDLNQIMLSAVYHIRPTIDFRLEGLINGEKEDNAKGWKKVNNDVLMFEAMFAW